MQCSASSKYMYLYVHSKLRVSFGVLPRDPTLAQHFKKPQAVLEPTFIVLVALPPNSSMTGLLHDIYIYTYVHTPTQTIATLTACDNTYCACEDSKDVAFAISIGGKLNQNKRNRPVLGHTGSQLKTLGKE